MSLIQKWFKNKHQKTQQPTYRQVYDDVDIKEIEQNGVDYKFVVNKILKNVNEKNSNYCYNAVRLSKLVLLVDIAYMQRYYYPLINSGYNVTDNGPFIPYIACVFENEIYYHKKLSPVNVEYQRKAERSVGLEFNLRVDDVVRYVLEATKYVSTKDLTEILNNQDLQALRKINKWSSAEKVDQELIVKFYKRFDFTKLCDLNTKGLINKLS